MDLYIVRHGETIANKSEIVDGQFNSNLSKIGKQQVVHAAHFLSNIKLDLILSSDLSRTMATAKAIAKKHPHIPLIKTAYIREAFLGHCEGKPNKYFNRIDWANPPIDVETFDSLIARAKIFVKHILRLYPEKKIAVVTHSGLGRALIQALQNKTEFPHHITLSNAGITHFKLQKNGKWKLVKLNHVTHLDKLKNKR